MGQKQVFVSGIAFDKERDFPVVLLRSAEEDEVVPIWIGNAEAQAILTVLAGRTFERPMTHDLMRLIVEELGARVGSIEITGLSEDTYFARIVLRRGEEVFYLDARPSDSIALALRAQAPVLIDEELFERCKRNLRVVSEDEREAGIDGAEPGAAGTDRDEGNEEDGTDEPGGPGPDRG